LTAISEYVGDDPRIVSAKELVKAYGYYLVGGFYPAGGSQAVANHLVKMIEDAGGSVQLRTPVTEILTESGRALGIKIGDGSVITSRVVISNADIRETFSKLVGPASLPEAYVQRMSSLKPSCSAFLVYLGLNCEPAIAPVTWVLDDQRIITINVPSQVEPTLAPEGGAAVTIISMTPQSESASWEREASEYRARKQRMGDELIELAETAIPDLRRHIVYRQDATPATMERYAWTSGGAIYGLDPGEWRPPVRTPVRGLFLAGAGTQEAAGFVQAVASGVLASEAALKELAETPTGKFT
jgi:all-trans-retinol 13,14-reductase